MKKLIYVILSLVLVAVSCNPSGDNGIDAERLAKAITYKDSALRYAAMVDSTASVGGEMGARQAMLRIISDYWQGRKPDNDSLAKLVTDRFKDADDTLKAMSLISAGFVNEQLGDEAKALPCYVEAAQLLKGSMQWGLLFTAYQRWGWLIKTEPPYKDALDKLDKADFYARKLGDYDKLSVTLGMKGWTLVFGNRMKKAQSVFDEALALAEEQGCSDMSWLFKSKASVCEMQGDHKGALLYTDKAIACNPAPDETLWGIKGTVLIGLGQYDSARIYIERGRLDKHYYQKASYYQELAVLEEALGNYKKALDYNKKYVSYTDSQYVEDQRLALLQLEKRYNYDLVSAERDRYVMANERKTAVIIAIVSVAAVAMLFLAWLYKRYRRRTADALAMKERLFAQSLDQVKTLNYELMRTRQEAQDKELELMSNISRKNEQLDALRRRQRELKESIMHTNDVICKIEALKRMNEQKKIKSAQSIALDEGEMQSLIDSTNLCYDNFTDRLKTRFGDVSTGDICLCCLLKLGIGAQDQSLLLGISDSTLRTRKYRLKKKKMNLSDDFETLDEFIKVF